MYSQLLQRVVQTPAHFVVQTIYQDRVGVTDHIFFLVSLKSSYKSTDINLAKLPWNNLEHSLKQVMDKVCFIFMWKNFISGT